MFASIKERREARVQVAKATLLTDTLSLLAGFSLTLLVFYVFFQ